MANSQNRKLAGVAALSAALISAACLWEGTKYVPYEDVVGVWTVCQGYAKPDVVRGKTYSKEECGRLLKTQLAEHGDAVLRCTDVPLNRHQYDAFTLFTYNVGGNAYCKSSLLKKLNAGDYAGACEGMLAWDMAGGKHVRGLYNRRKFERDLCLKPMEPPL